MSEERLKEIYDYNNTEYCVGEYDINNEIIDELYNEVVRLREIIDKANKFVDEFIQEDYYEKLDEYITHFTWNTTKDDLQDILKLEQNNLTLEQLNGVENE